MSSDSMFTSIIKRLDSVQKKPVSLTNVKLPAEKKVISETLSKLAIYCNARHFPAFQPVKHQIIKDFLDLPSHSDMRFDQISSLSERKVASIIKKNKAELIQHNNTFLTRIYPMATRVNSSNYDPIAPWSAGCQLVALNYQTIGICLQFCGIILIKIVVCKSTMHFLQWTENVDTYRNDRLSATDLWMLSLQYV